MRSRFAYCLCLLAALPFVPTSAGAQAYPAKPIRLIIPWPAGGGADVIGRTLGLKLGEALGQQMVAENRAGAAGIIGTEAAARAAPDGYTLYQGNTATLGINPALHAKLPYDAVRDFAPISLINTGTLIVVVHPSLPAKNIRDLIGLAKARPGQIIYGSSGQGAIVHLTTELFLNMAGVKMTHVPYKGGSVALTDLIAGQIQLVFATSQTGLPQAKAGRVRALAVTTPERIAAEPALPTIAESGVPGYEVTNWHALIGPKGLPRAVVERLHAETTKILRQKDMEERMQTDGISPAGGTPEELHRQVTKEIEQWRQVVQRAGIKIN